MTPTQVRKLEERVDRIEKKLDFVIHNYIRVDTGEDWIDDPNIISHLDKLADKAKKERLLVTADIFE